LGWHAWIWNGYRNYVRVLTNKVCDLSSAMALGVVCERFALKRFLTWGPLPVAVQAHSTGPVSGVSGRAPLPSPETPPS